MALVVRVFSHISFLDPLSQPVIGIRASSHTHTYPFIWMLFGSRLFCLLFAEGRTHTMSIRITCHLTFCVSVRVACARNMCWTELIAEGCFILCIEKDFRKWFRLNDTKRTRKWVLLHSPANCWYSSWEIRVNSGFQTTTTPSANTLSECARAHVCVEVVCFTILMIAMTSPTRKSIHSDASTTRELTLFGGTSVPSAQTHKYNCLSFIQCAQSTEYNGTIIMRWIWNAVKLAWPYVEE